MIDLIFTSIAEHTLNSYSKTIVISDNEPVILVYVCRMKYFEPLKIQQSSINLRVDFISSNWKKITFFDFLYNVTLNAQVRPDNYLLFIRLFQPVHWLDFICQGGNNT